MDAAEQVITFDRMLGQMFPECANIIAEMWDRPTLTKLLKKVLDHGIILNAIIYSGKTAKKNNYLLIDHFGMTLSDSKTKTGYRVGLPNKIMLARFTKHPDHNFIRVNHDGAPAGNTAGEKTVDGIQPKIKVIDKQGWFIIYPEGSLLSDPRLESQIRELVLYGRGSTLFSEFVNIDEEELANTKTVELIDYTHEDTKLWESWLRKIDTNLFKTNVRPRNYVDSLGRSKDYFLKIIKYGDKKVGAAWIENINQRTSTAELGLLIGEPHMWGMGIGKKALSAMINIAKNDLQLRFLWVFVREENRRAVNSYSGIGFSIARKVPVFNRVDGSYQMWLQMEKMI